MLHKDTLFQFLQIEDHPKHPDKRPHHPQAIFRHQQGQLYSQQIDTSRALKGMLEKRDHFNGVNNQPSNDEAEIKEPTIYSKVIHSEKVIQDSPDFQKLSEMRRSQVQHKTERQIFHYQQQRFAELQSPGRRVSHNRLLPVDLSKKQSLNDPENVESFQIDNPPEEESLSFHKLDKGKEKEKEKEKENANGEGLSNIWKTRSLRIVHFISKFIQQLKTKTDKLKFRFMNKKIFSIIGDIASDYDFILMNRIIKDKPSLATQLKHKLRLYSKRILGFLELGQTFFDEHITVLEPDSTFKILWDILVVLLIVINIFYIPLKISFNISKYQNQATQLLLETLPSWVFILEIVFNFNTAFYYKGMIHKDRKQIFKQYVKTNFWWDLIVVIPFLLSQFDIPYTDFTLLLRVTRVSAMVENLEEVLNLRLKDKVQAVFDLFKLVYFIVFVGHFCACAWFYLGQAQLEQLGVGHSWLSAQGIQDESFFTKYIYSLYWSTITTLTIGYGDLVPVTNQERMFVIFVALIICGVFGYSVSNIGDIFKSLQEKKLAYRSKLKIINQHIEKRGLSKYLQLKVRKYFEYYFMLEEEENSHAESLMSQLTKHLKEEVLVDIYKKTLKQSRLLRENFSEQTLDRLCIFLKEKKFAPEEIVFTKGELVQKMIFILSGELQIYTESCQQEGENTETLLRSFKPGFVIGEREFATTRMYEYNGKSEKFTQLALLEYLQILNYIFISYDDFIRVLKENHEEFERFCLIKDNLHFNENYKKLGQVCEVCGSNHRFLKCPFLFLQPNQAKIVSQHKNSKLHQRKVKQRNQRKSNCKQCLLDIQEAALALIVVNKIIPDTDLTDAFLTELGFKLADGTEINIEKGQNSNSVIALNTQQQLQTTENDAPGKTILGGDLMFSAMEQQLASSSEERDATSQIRKRVLSKKVLNQKSNGGNGKVDESILQEEELFSNKQNPMKSSKLKKMNLSKQTSMRKRLDDQQEGSQHNFSNQWSKLSLENNENGQSSALQSMQIIENKLFDKGVDFIGGGRRKKPKKQSSIVSNLQRKSSQVSEKVKPGKVTSLEEELDSQRSQNERIQLLKKNSINEKEPEKQPDKEEKPPQIIIELLHEMCDFNIDKGESSQIYFPIFNLENIIQKFMAFQRENMEKLYEQDKRKLFRTRTSISPFERIRALGKTQIRNH